MITAIGLLAALLLIAYLLFSGELGRRRVQHAKSALRTEKTRTSWAEAREELIRMVRAGELDPRSETFREFYQVQTFIMRRPDAYEEISDALTKVLVQRPEMTAPSWMDEVEKWPEGMKPMLSHMGEGMMKLIVHHSGVIRTLRSIWALASRVPQLKRELEGDESSDTVDQKITEKAPKDADTKKLVEAKKQLDRLRFGVAA